MDMVNDIVRSNAIVGGTLRIQDYPILLIPEEDDQLAAAEQEIGRMVEKVSELASSLIEETSRILWMTYRILDDGEYYESYKTQREYLDERFIPVTGIARSTALKYLKCGRFAFQHGLRCAEDLIKSGGPPVLFRIMKEIGTDQDGKITSVRGKEGIDGEEVGERVAQTLQEFGEGDLDLDWQMSIAESLGGVQDFRIDLNEDRLSWSAIIITDGIAHRKTGEWGPIPEDMPEEVQNYIRDHGVSIKL